MADEHPDSIRNDTDSKTLTRLVGYMNPQLQ